MPKHHKELVSSHSQALQCIPSSKSCYQHKVIRTLKKIRFKRIYEVEEELKHFIDFSNVSFLFYDTKIHFHFRFILYTKKNPTDGQLLNVNVNKTIVKSNFNPQRLTKMIIHGFIDTPLSNWVLYIIIMF